MCTHSASLQYAVRPLLHGHSCATILSPSISLTLSSSSLNIPAPAIDVVVDYQRTSVKRPFLASPAKTLCDRLSKAHAQLTNDILALRSVNLTTPSPKLSTRPTEWAHADLPACSYICGHSTICVYTGDCPCITSSCVERLRFPFFDSQHRSLSTFPPPPSNNRSLAERVGQSSRCLQRSRK